MSEIPLLREQLYPKQYTLRLSEDVKVELENLKHFEKVDVATWIRDLIDENLPKLKDKLANKKSTNQQRT